jgi:protein-tyrosine-phosphatase
MAKLVRAVVLLAYLAAGAVQAREATILFVCQFGSVKSAITRELFRRRAADTHVAVTAISRGITPEAHIDPALAARLSRDGIDPGRDPLQRLDEAALKQADIVVFFDKLPPELDRTDARDWSDLPSMVNSYDSARGVLDPRIDKLLAEISSR